MGELTPWLRMRRLLWAWRVWAAVADRARAGVAVKILLDAIGSATIGDEILQILEDGKCQLAWFNPLRWQTVGSLNYRTHRKTLVIDGKVGFTGGAGLADHWTGHAQDPAHWRDTQIRLEGPAVTPLQTGFAQNWLQTTGKVVCGPCFFPDVPRPGTLAVQTLLSSPSTGTSAARLLYYLSITCAQRTIEIANPYQESNVSFVDPELIIELDRAFEEDLRACERVTREAWHRRGWWQRLTELGASIFQEQA